MHGVMHTITGMESLKVVFISVGLLTLYHPVGSVVLKLLCKRECFKLSVSALY